MGVNLLKKALLLKKPQRRNENQLALHLSREAKGVECFLKTLLASEESVNMIVFSIRCYTRLQNVHGEVMIVFVRVP